MSTLTKDQLQELKSALLEQRDNLQRHFESNMEDGAPTASLKDSTGELSSYDNHPADAGTETFERSRDLAVDDTLTDEFNQVIDALERMEKGTYGTCVTCGQDIPFERLQAIPYTAYCIDDTPNRELSNDRPVEEQVMTMPQVVPGRSDSGMPASSIMPKLGKLLRIMVHPIRQLPQPNVKFGITMRTCSSEHDCRPLSM